MPGRGDFTSAISSASGKRNSVTNQRDNVNPFKNTFSVSVTGMGMSLLIPSAATVILTPRMKRLGGYDSFGAKTTPAAQPHQLEARATIFVAAESQ